MEFVIDSAYNAIVNKGYYNYLKIFSPKKEEGYMWTRDPIIEKIKSVIDEANPGYHSGATLAITLKMVQMKIQEESAMDPQNIE